MYRGVRPLLRGQRQWAFALVEDDGLVLVSQYLTLDVLLDGTAEHNLLEVLALIDERLGRVLVGYAYHVLLDDGSSVEVLCDIMARSADNLHTPLERLMVGLSTYEGRQERVVDVDDMVGVTLYHLRRDDLHVASQDDKRNTLLLKNFQLESLLLGLVLLRDGEAIVGDAETLGYGAQILVVAHDAGDVYIPLAGRVTR